MLALAGCDRPNGLAHDEPPTPATSLAEQFDAGQTGTVQGQVQWRGEMPPIRPFSSLAGNLLLGIRWLEMPNPNALRIDPTSQGVGEAVVYLRGVSPARSRPWDLPPLAIEVRNHQIEILAGSQPPARVGISRRGDAVRLATRQAGYEVLRGRGANFFALPFVEPEQPRSHVLTKVGPTEIASAARHPWMRAYVFVADHPYHTITDRQGRFTLPQVPVGDYQLVCWHPHYRVVRRDHDPETGLLIREEYAVAVEVSVPVQVAAGTRHEQRLTLRKAHFERPASPSGDGLAILLGER